MIDDKYQGLMNGELDGVNSAKDSAELQRYLASNEEARRYFKELKEMFRVICADPGGVPPPELMDNIIASIPIGKYSTARTNGRSVARWRDRLFARRLRYAGTFAAGLIVGVIIYAAAAYEDRGGGSFDNSSMYGTMRPIESTGEFEQVLSAAVDLDEASGEIRAFESRQGLLVEVSLQSPGEIEWVLEYDGNNVGFEGFRHLDGQSCDVAAAPAETRVHQHGGNKYVLYFTNTGRSTTPLVFKVFSADQKLLFEKILTSAASE